ncbi:hypothetical protein THRCLA_20461 [Thraustotheca clavata]|uniref:Uncharacterized protein n=1 Tax=Thraustotheca clavata TaxID=74557 RepID=A0A1W0A6W1_9STRA|nr:hypothetical protein THRCLA_20461 [Thraustotheca clavata]
MWCGFDNILLSTKHFIKVSGFTCLTEYDGVVFSELSTLHRPYYDINLSEFQLIDGVHEGRLRQKMKQVNHGCETLLENVLHLLLKNDL